MKSPCFSLFLSMLSACPKRCGVVSCHKCPKYTFLGSARAIFHFQFFWGPKSLKVNFKHIMRWQNHVKANILHVAAVITHLVAKSGIWGGKNLVFGIFNFQWWNYIFTKVLKNWSGCKKNALFFSTSRGEDPKVEFSTIFFGVPNGLKINFRYRNFSHV